MLFLVGSPITNQIEKLKIAGKKLPNSIAALITILIIVGLASGLFFVIIPPLVTEAKFLSELNFKDVLQNILMQFPILKTTLLKFGTEEELKQNLSLHVTQLINSSNITLIVNDIFHYLGLVLGGTLCVLFITFFLLKDVQIVKQTFLTITPSGFDNEMGDILRTSKNMLSKYFAGLFLDMFIVSVSAMIILSILGIKNALLISFVAGLLNIIPYVGSIITMTIAIFLGVSGCISAGSYELIGPTINKIFFALISINLIDGLILQPIIFSKSVKAHPLEIFIVTLMAATLGGIFGMVVALPTYTIIRIVAKEFLTHLKFFKKITDSIPE